MIKKILTFLFVLGLTINAYAAREYAQRYPTGTALEVYTPNNPPTPVAETDPVYSAWDKSTGISITESQISDFGTYLTAETDPYAVLLAGRSGGQTIKGGTGEGEDLSFWTNATGTVGSYFFTDLTDNGFVKTSGGTGLLSIDTNTYLTSLSGALLATGATTGATSQVQDFTTGVNVTNTTNGYQINNERVITSIGSVAGQKNIFIGPNENTVVTGNNNLGIGSYALNKVTTGNQNFGIGRLSLLNVTTGANNFAIGIETLKTNVSGNGNFAIGTTALMRCVSSFNFALGNNALFSNVDGSYNLAIGNNAGRYETGSNSFYLDVYNRLNTEGDKAGALLYGGFNSNPAL